MLVRDTSVPLPTSDDPVLLADWLELTMLVGAHTFAPRTAIRNALRTSVFVEEGLGTADLMPDVDHDDPVDPVFLDTAIAGLCAEIERRALVAGTSYPFRVDATTDSVTLDGTVIKDRARAGIVYPFLLCVSVSLSLQAETRFREVDEVLDLLVLEALRAYLGPATVGVRFGVPKSGDRPGGFARAIPWLAGKMGLRVGGGTLRSHQGDGGADVVVWRPMGDDREGFLSVLAQCTVQRQWQRKGHDIHVTKWRGWIDFGPDPATCLAIPYVIPLAYPQWDEVRRTATIILERVRLTRLIEALPPSLDRRLRAWTAAEIKRLSSTPSKRRRRPRRTKHSAAR